MSRLDDVYLYTVDDLGRLAQSAVESRRAAVAQAEAIIETRVDGFMQWLSSREMVPMIRQLNDRGEAIRQAELDRARRMLARGDDPEAVLEALAHGLTGKFLHGPMTLVHHAHLERDALGHIVEHLLPEPGGHPPADAPPSPPIR